MDNPAPIVGSPGNLYDMSFNVFFNKVLCKATPSTVKFLREHMENQGEIIRGMCIQKLNELMPKATDFFPEPKLTVTDINVCAFLDCVLDVTFTKKLEINIMYKQNFKSYSQLFSIIAQRCPKLKSLAITFYSNLESKTSMSDVKFRLEDFKLAQVTHRLYHLETLDLCHTHVPLSSCSIVDYETFLRNCDSSILAIVAEYCPALVNLIVRGFYIRDRDVLGLITGASAKTLFLTPTNRWAIYFNRIHSLVVPGDLMSPLCFTLRTLQLIPRWQQSCVCNADVSETAAAFAFKHLPELRTSSHDPTPTIGVIELLYSDRGAEKTENQTAFEEHCRLLTNITRHPHHPSPTGFLGLSELEEHFQLLNANRLRAIGWLCPHLDRFKFFEVWLRNEVPPEELESILSAWPKLTRISLIDFKFSISTRTILRAFSSSLTDLSLNHCSSISFSHLSPCTQLQRLRIFYCVLYSDTSLDTDSFLPSLKEFESNVCLGEFAHLFERKSTLTDAYFNCCHIGTNAYNDPAVEWSQVPKMWPHMRSLRIGQATGLTMDIVSKFVTEMPAIMHIELPPSVTLEAAGQLDCTRKITQDGCERKQRLVIRHSWKSLSRCIYHCT